MYQVGCLNTIYLSTIVILLNEKLINYFEIVPPLKMISRTLLYATKVYLHFFIFFFAHLLLNYIITRQNFENIIWFIIVVIFYTSSFQVIKKLFLLLLFIFTGSSLKALSVTMKLRQPIIILSIMKCN